jgi:hypothetical protein
MSSTFAINERVLCYHGPLIYEAKVLKAETWDEETTKLGSLGPHYFVHYKGWKQTYALSLRPVRYGPDGTLCTHTDGMSGSLLYAS